MAGAGRDEWRREHGDPQIGDTRGPLIYTASGWVADLERIKPRAADGNWDDYEPRRPPRWFATWEELLGVVSLAVYAVPVFGGTALGCAWLLGELLKILYPHPG